MKYIDKRIETTYTIELSAVEVTFLKDRLSVIQGPSQMTTDFVNFFSRLIANLEP